MFQCCERISSFSGLRDRKDKRIFIGNGFSITIFARNLYITWDFCESLQPILGDHSRVITRAAGKNQNAFEALKHSRSFVPEHGAGNTDNTFQGIGNRLRLLKDFLLHVMRVGSERNILAETLNN